MSGNIQTKQTWMCDMAEPTEYDKDYDFSAFQSTKPDEPLPGDRLDTELQNIETALDETQGALRDIRRSDGQLQNDIVTPDSISDATYAVLGLAETPNEDVVTVAENIDAVNDVSVNMAEVTNVSDNMASVITAAQGHIAFYGLSAGNTPAENDTAIAAMAADPQYIYDLLGTAYPVTAVPSAPRFENGGWLVAGTPPTIYPAENTVRMHRAQVSDGTSQYEIGSQGAVSLRGRGTDVSTVAVVHKGLNHYSAGTEPHIFAKGRDEVGYRDEGPIAVPASDTEAVSCFALGCFGNAMFAGVRASGGAAETDKVYYRRVSESRFNQSITFSTTSGSATVSAQLAEGKHWDVRPGDYVIISDTGASINNVIINGLANSGLGYPVVSHDPSTRTITFVATNFDAGSTADATGSETRTTPEITFSETSWTPILTVETGTDYTLLHGLELFLDGADLVGQSGVHGTGATGCEFLRFTGLFATPALSGTTYTLGGEASETLVEPLALQLSTGAQVVSARTQDSSTIAPQVGYAADGNPSNATLYALAAAFDKSPVAIAADEANDWLYFVLTAERDAGGSDPASVPVYVIQQQLSDFIANGFDGEYWQIGTVHFGSQNDVTSTNGVGVADAVVDDGTLQVFLTTEQQNRAGDEDGRPRVQCWTVAVGSKGVVGGVERAAPVEVPAPSTNYSYRKRSDAAAADIPAPVVRIRVASWNGRKGGAHYKRSDATETVDYPSLSWFRSADGAYWLLDENLPAPSMLGGYAHESFDEMTHDDAVDSTDALDAVRAYANTRGVPWLVDAFYRFDGQWRFDDEGETMLGIGQWKCGIETRNTATQTGPLVAADYVTVMDVGFRAYLTEPKGGGGGTGMIGCGFILGYYLDAAVLAPKGFYIDRIMITRKDNEVGHTSYNAFAFQIGAGANEGYAGAVTITGRHSCAYQSHWDGDNTEVDGTITESGHPRDFVLNTLIVLGGQVVTLVTLSSTSCVSIRTVVADTCRSVFNFLAGDETDTFNNGYPNIGANNRIGSLTCNNVTTTGLSGTNNEAVSVTSLGTSKFRTEEGMPAKDQLRCDVEIGSLCIHSNDAAIVYGIDLFEFYGRFVVRSARITGFVEALRARKTRGEIAVHMEFTDGRVEIQDSDAVLTGTYDRGDYTSTADTNRNVFINSTSWSVSASDITRNDTTVTVPAGITQDIERGSQIELTGTTGSGVESLTFDVDVFNESGLTVVDIGQAIPHDMTGVTLKYLASGRAHINPTRMVGSRTGVHVKGGYAKIEGGVSAGRFNVTFEGAETFVEYEIEKPVSGLLRQVTEGYSLYDIFGIGSGGHAIVSGKIGAGKVSASGLYFSIGATGTPDATVILKDAVIVNDEHVIGQPENEVELTVSNCVRQSGGDYNIFDALGIAQTGNDANGYWCRNLDGTMECWSQDQDIGATQSFTWTFPDGGFVAADSVSVHVTPASPTAPRMGHGRATSATEAEIWAHNDDGTDASSTDVNLHAKGFWKAL